MHTSLYPSGVLLFDNQMHTSLYPSVILLFAISLRTEPVLYTTLGPVASLSTILQRLCNQHMAWQSDCHRFL